MKLAAGVALLCCVAGVSGVLAMAQENGSNGPPKVLVINREYTKPGRGGSMHEKTEEGYKAAAKAGKAPYSYLAMTSMSGPDRALFLSGYASFKAWEDESKVADKLPGLGAGLDHAMVADGDLLSETDSSVWVRQDDMSMNMGGITGVRYFELTVYKLKPGHEPEWAEAVKMVKAAYEKAIPDARWDMFSEEYGDLGSAYLVVVPLKSMAEKDEHMMGGAKFAEAMGKDGMKKLDSLMAESVDAEMTNLFHFSPKMSIVPQAWIDAEPDYWKPKVSAPMKKKDSEK